jgi:steroid delta-isomerase
MRADVHRHLSALADWYERLTPETLALIAAHYDANAWFKDPFNEVRGLEAIRRVFAHMFATLRDPRFRVTERLADEGGALLVWEFRFGAGRRDYLVRGASHLRFDARGRVTYHRDYWDTAEELYAKVPLLGGLMRLLRRRLAAR